MRTLRSHLLALIVPDFENVFFTRVARGLEEVGRPRDSFVFIGSSDDDPQKEQHYLNVALAERVGGIVIAPTTRTQSLGGLKVSGIPVVLIDQAIPGSGFDTVVTDNRAGGRMGATHIRSEGMHRLVCIAGPPNPTSTARLDGAMDVVNEGGDLAVQAIEYADNRVAGGYEAMKRLISQTMRFDSVFVTNNLMAVGAVNALRDLMPDQVDGVEVVGFDLKEMTWVPRGKIASVDQNAKQIGVIAGEHIFRQQEDSNSVGELMELAPSLNLLSHR
jgi:LacI family transcriptional regulator